MHSFLPQTAEYALRAMTWMATHPEVTPVRAKELSEGTGIPIHYLSKVLRRLVLAGILVSQKGHHGGFAMACPLGDISFKDILNAVNAYPVPDRCAFGWGTCDGQDPCPLHDSWGAMSDAFCNWASSTTLAQVGQGEGK